MHLSDSKRLIGVILSANDCNNFFKVFFRLISVVLPALILSGCLGSVVAGLSVAYDRHNVYKKLSDFTIKAELNRRIYRDTVFKRPDCRIEVTVMNGDVLFTGHVPTESLRQELESRIQSYPYYRRFFNYVILDKYSRTLVNDFWITMNLRSRVVADSAINPGLIKIRTSSHIVYLMGDVPTPQAKRVIDLARRTWSVKEVVTLFKYYNLSDHAD